MKWTSRGRMGMRFKHRRWRLLAKRRREDEDVKSEEKRLAELMRGVRPIKRGGFHSPAKKAEQKTERRRAKRMSLKGKVREYNARKEVD